MTPLAQRLMGELMEKPHKSRARIMPSARGFGSADMLTLKFFDLRKAFDVFPEGDYTFDVVDHFPPALAREMDAIKEAKSDFCFAPASRCWFETHPHMAVVLLMTGAYAGAQGDLLRSCRRQGVVPDYMGDDDDGIEAGVMLTAFEDERLIGLDQLATIMLRKDRSAMCVSPESGAMDRIRGEMGREEAQRLLGSVCAFLQLSLICVNSSRYAVSNNVLPGERDRQRSLRGKSLVGKFPLRAYSEITLRPGETLVPEPQNCATTGERAQHFVRSHLRHYKASGKTVRVMEHYRGNPALGMCQHRYKVEKP